MQRRSRCYRSSFDKCNARFAAGALAESEICGAQGLACMSVKSQASTSDFRALRRRRRSNGDDAVPIPSQHRSLVQSGGGVRPLTIQYSALKWARPGRRSTSDRARRSGSHAPPFGGIWRPVAPAHADEHQQPGGSPRIRS